MSRRRVEVGESVDVQLLSDASSRFRFSFGGSEFLSIISRRDNASESFTFVDTAEAVMTGDSTEYADLSEAFGSGSISMSLIVALKVTADGESEFNLTGFDIVRMVSAREGKGSKLV